MASCSLNSGSSLPYSARNALSSSRLDVLAAFAAAAHVSVCYRRQKSASLSMSEATKCSAAARDVAWLATAVSTGLRIASPPVLTLCVRTWRNSALMSVRGMASRAGSSRSRMATSSGLKCAAVPGTTLWTYYHSPCKHMVKAT